MPHTIENGIAVKWACEHCERYELVAMPPDDGGFGAFLAACRFDPPDGWERQGRASHIVCPDCQTDGV